MLTHLQTTPAAPERVVILGANGFVARALAAKLATDQTPVLAISRQDIDLTAPAAGQALSGRLQSTDAVVMTAALTPDKGRDTATLMKNLRMAENVAQALAARSCRHFVYISSDAVYDWRHPLISESVAPSPTDLYSLMHLAREQMLGQAAAGKVPCCILRPCAIYGAGDTHNSYGPNRFIRTALAEGKIRLFGAGEEMRDHVCIDDVVVVIGLALRHRSIGTLNVISGRSVSFGEVAGLVARLSPPPVTIETQERSGPVTHRHFDSAALLRAFPQHQPTDLAEGLHRLAAAS